MLICLLQLPYLFFLIIKTIAELSQYIFNSLEIESMILSLNIKLFNYTPCPVFSKQETNLDFIVIVTIKVYLALL